MSAGGSRTSVDVVIVAGLEPIRRQHTIDIEASDVLWAADRDHFALQVFEALDARFREQRIGRRLDFEARDAQPRTLLGSPDRIHQPGGERHVERACRKLLDRVGACRDIDQINLDVSGGEKAFVDPDEERSEVG
jgi:hypothetical protein